MLFQHLHDVILSSQFVYLLLHRHILFCYIKDGGLFQKGMCSNLTVIGRFVVFYETAFSLRVFIKRYQNSFNLRAYFPSKYFSNVSAASLPSLHTILSLSLPDKNIAFTLTFCALRIYAVS